MFKVTKVYFEGNEKIGSENRHEHEPRKGVSMVFEPETGMLMVRVGDRMRFYSPTAYRFVEGVQEEGKKR